MVGLFSTLLLQEPSLSSLFPSPKTRVSGSEEENPWCLPLPRAAYRGLAAIPIVCGGGREGTYACPPDTAFLAASSNTDSSREVYITYYR